MREREIRYLMGTSTQTRVIPVAEGVSDEDVAEIARRLTGLVYEREVTPWRHVAVGPSSTEPWFDQAEMDARYGVNDPFRAPTDP